MNEAERQRRETEAEAEATRIAEGFVRMHDALVWIQAFAEGTNAHGIPHPGFVHVERRSRAAIRAAGGSLPEPAK